MSLVGGFLHHHHHHLNHHLNHQLHHQHQTAAMHGSVQQLQQPQQQTHGEPSLDGAMYAGGSGSSYYQASPPTPQTSASRLTYEQQSGSAYFPMSSSPWDEAASADQQLGINSLETADYHQALLVGGGMAGMRMVYEDIDVDPSCVDPEGGGRGGMDDHHQQQLTAVTAVAPVRTVKRRYTANRKERRRTLSINNAFADLRDCIPNVPADTKLSKIKTLRLATSYIAYLMDILAKDDPSLVPEGGFKAEVNKKIETREEKKKREMASLLGSAASEKRTKGRTGWPQHVWALELKQ